MDTVEKTERTNRSFAGSQPVSKVKKLMPVNEDEIVRKAMNGDHDSFIKLFDKYKGFVWNVAYRMTYDFDEAEDLTQEVFISVWKNLKSFRGASVFSTWIYRVTVNKALNKIKRRCDHMELNEESGVGEIDEEAFMRRNAGAVFEQFEAERTLSYLLSKLGSERRIALILYECEGLSYEQIASATDVSVGTVRSRIARARREIKKIAADI